MKITPNKQSFQEGYSRPAPKPCAFEKVLLDTSHNKTSDDMGDLYYWEHLESLQQSRLLFNHQEVINTQSPDESKLEVAFEKSTIKNVGTINNTKHHTPCLREKNGGSQEAIERSLNKTRDNPFSPSLTPKVAFQSASQKIENTPKTQKAVLEKAFKTCTHYKNHHLFIENGQVELTLNLQDTHPFILKPLLIQIKTWLANNHLRLRKFILNGVQT